MFESGRRRRATYQDVLDAPEHVVAEIIDGELWLSPRPAGPHTAAKVRAEPFDAIELDLADLWADLEMPPPRKRKRSLASESVAVYGDAAYEDAP